MVIILISDTRKKSIDAKPNGLKVCVIDYIVSQDSEIYINYNGKTSKLHMAKLGRHHPNP